MLICMAALLLKLLIPSGYMIAGERGRMAITLCDGFAAGAVTMAMPGMHGDMPDHRGPDDHGKPEMPCAFSGLSAPALWTDDPVLPATFIAFIVAIGLRPAMRPAPGRRVFLRPPMRGPPVRP